MAVKTLARAQYSLVATAYTRLLVADFEPAYAMRCAFIHAWSLFAARAPVSFDRCFEFVRLFDARRGVGESELDLLASPKCHSRYLGSHKDQAPPRCPFCALIRTPQKYL